MCKVFVPSLGFIGDIARNLVLNICHGHYINSTVDKIFFHDIISWYIALVWNFNSVINISFNCKYPAGNCMFGVDNGDAGAACGVRSRLVVMYMYICSIYVCVYVCACIYVCVYIYIWMCVCVFVYINVCVCMCANVYM